MKVKADSRLLQATLGSVFNAVLESMRAQHAGIIAALVCTSDGFALASAHANEETSRRLSAIVSSLHGLGLAVVDEMLLGRYGHLSIDASSGKCIFFDLPSSGGRLLLGAIANDSLLSGHLLAASRRCRDELDRLLQERAAEVEETAGDAPG
jgi:predicted regulator of Ras-like GTPase activity (Roadblock/LC7/MglB family)